MIKKSNFSFFFFFFKHLPLSSQFDGAEELSFPKYRVVFISNTAFAYCCACSVVNSCPTLCNPMDCSPLGSSVHGILQARILEWVAISSSRDLPDPGIEPTSPASPELAGRFFTTESYF